MQTLKRRLFNPLASLMRCRSGDQVTGWLIVVLIVVVTGAVFLSLYQSTDCVKSDKTQLLEMPEAVISANIIHNHFTL